MTSAFGSNRIVTAAERPDLADRMNSFTSAAWPEFMHHDSISNLYWKRLYPDFSAYQFAMIDPAETILAVGNSLPISWAEPFEKLPDTGWDWEVETAFHHLDSKIEPTTLCAVQIVVDPKLRGSGLSRQMVTAMRDIATRHHLTALIAPVRPNQKSLYPLTPIERYITWHRPDSSLFDPWLRVHASLGARLIGVCHHAMTIPGTVADWEKWTGLTFPDSGNYVIPGALVPISIDRKQDRGIYIEPNVWMVHPVGY